MPIRKKSSRVPPMQMAKEYLQAYPSATNDQVVLALDVSVRTVTSARAALIQMGLIPRSYFDRKNMSQSVVLASPPDPLTVEGVAELGKALDAIVSTPGGLPGLTLPEMRERLSTIARRAGVEGSGQLEIAAIQAIAKLDASTGERDRLGPGVPLSRADKIARLSILMNVCGRSITGESFMNVFGKEPNGKTTQENLPIQAVNGTSSDGARLPECPDPLCTETSPENPDVSTGTVVG